MVWLKRTSTLGGPLSVALALAMVGCGFEGSDTETGGTAEGDAAQSQSALSVAGSTSLPNEPKHQAYREYLASRAQGSVSAQSAAAEQTLPEYAAECEAATGIAVPAFSCENGVEVPGQGTGDRQSGGPCDAPNVLNGACDPGSKFQVLAKNASAAVVVHCRKNRQLKSSNLYNDIAIIQYNKDNGAVCFYQALNNLDGRNIPAPISGSSAFNWLSPAATQSLDCTSCHDNGGFIRSRYLAQLTTGPHVLPSVADGFSNLNTPLRFVGAAFAGSRSWSVTTAKASNDTGTPCTDCHRLAVNNIWLSSGTAGNFARIATAERQSSKSPHSPTSPIWMRPGQTFYDAGAAATALRFQDCAAGFWAGRAAGFTTPPATLPAGCSFAPLGVPWVASPFAGVNIGITGGLLSTNGSTHTITAAGTDIGGTADQFFFAYQSLYRDGTAEVRVQSLVNTDPLAKAGLMFRADSGGADANVMLAITPTSGAVFQHRQLVNGATSSSTLSGRTAPTWLRVVRAGNTYTGFVSTDRVSWIQVGTISTYPMPYTLKVGLAVTSHKSGVSTTATFDSFSWTPATPDTLADTNIGITGGKRVTSGSTHTITAGGADIWNNSDQFFYSYRAIEGDGTAVVRVNSQTNSNAWAKAGLMFRDGSGTGAANAMIAITPTSGAIFQHRLTNGATSTNQILTGRAAPTWLRIVRSGDTFIGSVSSDGTTWTQVGSPVTFASFASTALGSTALLGMAVTSHNTSATSTATFDSFSWTPATPSTLSDANIGITGGSRTVAGATHTIRAAGADIWGSSDQFFYSFKTHPGDGTIIAKVTGLTNTHAFAKAGLMFRNSSGSGSANAMIAITGSSGALFQSRPSDGAASTNSILAGRSVPTWLRLVRSGNTFTGSVSTNGLTWTQVGSPTTISGIDHWAQVGLAVTSHNAGVTTTATFTDVSVP